MHTSYFGNIKNIQNPVSIAGKMPDFCKELGVPEFRKLAPKFWFFDHYKKGIIDSERYTFHYNSEVLTQWETAQMLIDELISRFGDNITMLCWEKPTNFCHRHIVADFITRNTMYNVTEI